jgi:glycosyltransferase involved in cell wall biosynthesis
MLKVIVDATPITAKPSGVGLYVTNLIKHLYLLQQSEQFRLGIFYQPSLKNWLKKDFSWPNLPSSDENFAECEESSCFFFPYPVRVSNWFLKNFPQVFPLLLDKSLQDYQIFHGTNFTVYCDRSTLKVITLYDLTFLKYPQYIDRVVAQYNQRVRQCLQWTDLIITISESTKQDAIKYLGVSPEKIFVTPLASRYDVNYLQQEEIAELQTQVNYNFEIPYLLFVSTIEPRKNIITLIQAFNYLKEKYRIEHNLVLIGKKGWKYQEIFNAIANSPYNNYIHHLDYLSDKLVALFYKLATVFVYPSHYEGFGLPVLEAMTLGTPVICANTSSLPEVVGDAGIQINPNKPLELADAIREVINNSQLQQNLVTKGFQQASNFSWEKTAQKTLEAYRKLHLNTKLPGESQGIGNRGSFRGKKVEK